MASAQQKFLARAGQEYRKVCQIPCLTAATVVHKDATANAYHIQLQWNQKELERNTKKHVATSALFNASQGSFQQLPCFAIEEPSDVVCECVSHSFRLKAVIKSVKVSGKDDQVVCEVWSKDKSRLEQCINLSTLDIHGKVHANSEFGRLSFNKDESKLLYLAEKKKEKSPGFFERQKPKVSSSEEDAKEEKGDKYVYEESWGEQRTDITNTVICILDLQTETVSVLSNVPSDVSPSNPLWGPNDSVLYIGLGTEPFRLGRIYCSNRKGALYHQTVLTNDDGTTTEGPTDILAGHRGDKCLFAARMSNCGSKLMVLMREFTNRGDPHMAHCSVGIYDFTSKKLEVGPDSYKHDGKMMQLYAFDAADRCWLNDSVHVALICATEGEWKCVLVDTVNHFIKSMTNAECVLTTFDSYVLVKQSALNSIGAGVAVINGTGDQHVSMPAISVNILDGYTVGSVSDVPGVPVASHYIIPDQSELSRSSKAPLIVWPHGGPHSVLTPMFMELIQGMARVGYAVLLLNYRGSVGFNKEVLDALPGHIGTVDVQDCQSTVEHFIEKFQDRIDAENVYVSGGSHGGFLTAQMIGQFPDFYRAAALRNPVINLASMASTSDIPDWVYFESGIPYDQCNIPDADSLKSMVEKSPIIHVDKVKAPVLLLIGDKDARVPPTQGKLYHKLLRAHGKVSKLLLYPDDCHPLGGVETSADMFMNMCKWFYTYRKE